MKSAGARPDTGLTGTLTIDELLSDLRYGQILAYPSMGVSNIRRRLDELCRLNVTHVEFGGRSEVRGVRVLGKGCVGLVVTAHTPSGSAALKIRRVDANRRSLHPEAKMLKAANGLGVGPQLFSHSWNLLLMELVQGDPLPDWVRSLRGRSAKAEMQETLRRLLGLCYRLDAAGLDHGQLSRAAKHIMVRPTGHPQILDFESASLRRNPSNLTSICQYIFIGSKPARTTARLLGLSDKRPLLEALRRYKADISLDALHRVEDSARLLPA